MSRRPFGPFAPLLDGADRVLVVVAHPDDEVLGCGALLARLRDPKIVHVTDGSPANPDDARRHGFADGRAYAAARRREAEAALAMAGHGPGALSCLGITDQDASLHLAAIARRLVPLLAEADLVLTHAFEGGHCDHDAAALATHAAWRLTPMLARPRLFEMPFYHADADGWVRQRFLPQAGAGPERVVVLDPEDQDLKRRMRDAHASQAGTLADFALDAERFRAAPPYDFGRLPHDGPLLYERHGWNLTAATWRARVAAAEAALGRC